MKIEQTSNFVKVSSHITQGFGILGSNLSRPTNFSTVIGDAINL
jgi:hypothetical protein